MLDREEKPRIRIVRQEKSEEERIEQLKAAVKPKEVESVYQCFSSYALLFSFSCYSIMTF